MSVEGQDARAWIVLCDAQSGAHLTVEPYPVLPETPIGIERGDYEIVVPKSALVESEAREEKLRWSVQKLCGERDQLLDQRRTTLAALDREEADSRQLASKVDEAEAREAVLVEALKELDSAIEDELVLIGDGFAGPVKLRTDSTGWRRILAARAAVPVALAGVVEAEPEGSERA